MKEKKGGEDQKENGGKLHYLEDIREKRKINWKEKAKNREKWEKEIKNTTLDYRPK